MAQRLCFDERTRIEVMSEAGLSVAEMADRLGRCRSTVYRELGGGGGCESPRGCRRGSTGLTHTESEEAPGGTGSYAYL